jgi:uncharacterized protein (TIGR02118 family)
MEKLITLMVKKEGLSLGEFRDRLLGGHAELIMRHRPRLERYIVSIADVPAEAWGGDPSAPPRAYDGVIETWYASTDDFTDPKRAWDSDAAAKAVQADGAALIGAAHTYRVREVIQKEYERDWPVGQRSPGIKSVYPVTRTDWLTPEQFASHWHNGHGPLALKHHIGLSKYVQNVVLESLSEGAPHFDGIAELHFPTSEDKRDRSIDSPEGAAIIGADVAKFVGSAFPHDCSEYILKA